MERRCKGGKERCVKGCQKTAKSLQAYNMHSPGSVDPVEPSKKLLLSLLQLFIFTSNEPYVLSCLMHVNLGHKPGKNGATGGGNSSGEVQALSKEVG